MMEEYSKQATIKPISEYVAITSELERLIQLVSDLQYQLKDAQSKIGNDQVIPKTMLVYNNGTSLNLRLSHIVMIEADSSYSTLYMADGTKIYTSKTMKYWGQKIKDNQEFIRPHRSFIINRTHLLSYEPSSKTIKLTGGFFAKVSRTFKF
jgi:DNA-binding LytR/AlgR family response regulator